MYILYKALSLFQLSTPSLDSDSMLLVTTSLTMTSNITTLREDIPEVMYDYGDGSRLSEVSQKTFIRPGYYRVSAYVMDEVSEQVFLATILW